MGAAIAFGLLGSSALVLGALVGGRFQIPKRVLAAMLAFASGALITALAYELFEDAHEQGGLWRAGLGLLVGAAVFTFLSARLDRAAAADVPDDEEDERGSEKLDKRAAIEGARPSRESVRGAAGLALLAAVTLDGIPENVALGVSLGEGTGGIALLGAIFVSNFPEALVGSASMRAQGRSQRFVVLIWIVCALLLTAAVVVGAGPLANTSPETISLPLAFAAGAVLASLADTLSPRPTRTVGRPSPSPPPRASSSPISWPRSRRHPPDDAGRGYRHGGSATPSSPPGCGGGVAAPPPRCACAERAPRGGPRLLRCAARPRSPPPSAPAIRTAGRPGRRERAAGSARGPCGPARTDGCGARRVTDPRRERAGLGELGLGAHLGDADGAQVGTDGGRAGVAEPKIGPDLAAHRSRSGRAPPRSPSISAPPGGWPSRSRARSVPAPPGSSPRAACPAA